MEENKQIEFTEEQIKQAEEAIKNITPIIERLIENMVDLVVPAVAQMTEILSKLSAEEQKALCTSLNSNQNHFKKGRFLN